MYMLKHITRILQKQIIAGLLWAHKWEATEQSFLCNMWVAVNRRKSERYTDRIN